MPALAATYKKNLIILRTSMKQKLILFLLLLNFACLFADSGMTRGTEPGGIFLASAQYHYCPEEYHAVFYSPDNGETLIRRYFYNPLYGRRILSDAQL
jgi:hypothetical protein